MVRGRGAVPAAHTHRPNGSVCTVSPMAGLGLALSISLYETTPSSTDTTRVLSLMSMLRDCKVSSALACRAESNWFKMLDPAFSKTCEYI